jgi:hypothetical protein
MELGSLRVSTKIGATLAADVRSSDLVGRAAWAWEQIGVKKLAAPALLKWQIIKRQTSKTGSMMTQLLPPLFSG